MGDNYTCVFNLLVAALLIQNVAHVAGRISSYNSSFLLIKHEGEGPAVPGDDRRLRTPPHVHSVDIIDDGVDFATYENDETAIPEDIVYQERIQDDDDLIDADDSEAADIVLESESFSSRNVSSYEGNENNDNERNSKKCKSNIKKSLYNKFKDRKKVDHKENMNLKCQEKGHHHHLNQQQEEKRGKTIEQVNKLSIEPHTVNVSGEDQDKITNKNTINNNCTVNNPKDHVEIKNVVLDLTAIGDIEDNFPDDETYENTIGNNDKSTAEPVPTRQSDFIRRKSKRHYVTRPQRYFDQLHHTRDNENITSNGMQNQQEEETPGKDTVNDFSMKYVEDSAPHKHKQQTTKSAFHTYKTLRRNNRRYGHRSHKKKYKDFLRYGMTTASTSMTNTNGSASVPGSVVTATLEKLSNTTGDNYQQPKMEQYTEKLQEYEEEIVAEKSRGQAASPIFSLANRNIVDAADETAKPFYEGQINYYTETEDENTDKVKKTEGDQKRDSNMNIMAATDNTDWYRLPSPPVLRNGVKSLKIERRRTHRKQQQQQKHEQQHHHHHYRKQLQHKNYQSKQQPQRNSYQRKLPPFKQSSSSPLSTPYHSPYPPLPSPTHKHAGAMQELGHQITEMEEFERYYAKWPHLARVQFQVYDEHRELHPELYADYEYDSAAELESVQNIDDEDANLPPYIKKYNRRNKQLLNLLEGTLPPPTQPTHMEKPWSGSLLQPGPHDSRSSSGGVRHYQDIFAAQKGESAESTTESRVMQFDQYEQPKLKGTQNHLPDEDISISQDIEDSNWQMEMETKSNADGEMTGSAEMAKWQIEKLPTPATMPLTTPKAAFFKLPSYPAITGSFVSKQRSRSAQFAPSSGGSRGNSFIQSGGFGFIGAGMGGVNSNNYKSLPLFTAFDVVRSNAGTSTMGTMSPAITSFTTEINSAPNSFIYHRVVMDGSPRLVGAGNTGFKQRLPFVAITDRRLETSKKTLLERQRDFEQNHFPMP